MIEPDTDEPQEMGDFEIVEVSFFWAFCLEPRERDDEQESEAEKETLAWLWGFVNFFFVVVPQVTEEMMEQANEKKMDAVNALGEGVSTLS